MYTLLFFDVILVPVTITETEAETKSNWNQTLARKYATEILNL